MQFRAHTWLLCVICIQYSALGDRKFSKIWTPATRTEDTLCILISNKMLMNHLMLEGILVRRGALAPHGWLVSGSFVFVSDLKKFRGFNTCAGDYALGTVRSSSPGGTLRFQKTCPAGLVFSGAGHVVALPDSRAQRGVKGPFCGFCSNLEGTPLGQLGGLGAGHNCCLLYTSPSPRDQRGSRMPSSA